MHADVPFCERLASGLLAPKFGDSLFRCPSSAERSIHLSRHLLNQLSSFCADSQLYGSPSVLMAPADFAHPLSSPLLTTLSLLRPTTT